MTGFATNVRRAAPHLHAWLRRALGRWPLQGRTYLDPDRLNDHLLRDLGFHDGRIAPPRDEEWR